jgi:hypothetical protein
VTSGEVDIEREVEDAADYWARQQERSSSDIPLTVLLITQSGQRIVVGVAGGMSDELRPHFGQVIRQAVGEAVSEPIEAFVTISTAWYSTRLDIRPRDDPEAGEVLMVYGSTRQGQRTARAYEMLRFGDEVRLKPMDWKMNDTYSPTYEQIFGREEEQR